jgi:Primase C terminal 2 (PriCT-2)
MSIGAAHKSSTIRATEGLTTRGFAEFVDNVDTRARRKIHLISPPGASYRLDGARCWGGGTAVANVIDVDVEGLSWFDTQSLPLTRMHQSQSGGFHLLFRHSPGLRNSADHRIARGIHVRAEDGFAIFWPRQGLPVCDAPIAEWPKPVLALALGPCRKRNLPRERVHGWNGEERYRALEALRKLNPGDYREHDEWLRLMMAAHAAGIDRETFIEWSIGDPLYANEAEEIGRRWDSLKPDGGVTARVLFVEARLAELDRFLQTGLGALPWQVPFRAGTTFEPTQNLKLRVNGILRMVERARGDGREPALFRAACVIREIIAEGRLQPKPALSLMESACRINRLWTEAPRVCRRTIASGFLTVEFKLKEG